MSHTKSRNDLIARRGELLAELFLQDLDPEFVARPTFDFGYDFFMGFRNSKGGINIIAVEVKATERVVKDRFPIRKSMYEQWANSNIPILFLVVDVKQNRFFFAWPSQTDSGRSGESEMISLSLDEIDDTRKKELRARLAS